MLKKWLIFCSLNAISEWKIDFPNNFKSGFWLPTNSMPRWKIKLLQIYVLNMLRHNKIVTKYMNGYKAIKTHAFIIGIFQRIRTIFRKKKLKLKNLRIKSKIFWRNLTKNYCMCSAPSIITFKWFWMSAIKTQYCDWFFKLKNSHD